MDAIAHGEIQPPELHFSETPRPGTALTHRLVALFSGPAPAPAGGRARGAAGGRAEARRVARADGRRAEDRPPPRRVRRRRRQGARGAKDVRLDVLGAVEPRRALPLRVGRRPSCPSDLERLLEHVLLRTAPASVPPTARVRLDRVARRRLRGRRPEPGRVPRAERRLPRRRSSSARTLDARDFHEDGGAIASAADGAELGKRADRAVATLKARARTRSPQRIAAGARRSAARRARRPRLPRHPRGGPGLGARRRRRRSLSQARTIEAEATRRLARSTRSRPASTRRPDRRPAREARAGAARSRLRARLQGAAARPPEERGRARHRVRAARTSCSAASRSRRSRGSRA